MINKYLEKIASKKKLLDVAKNNPFLDNVGHLAQKMEQTSSKSSIPGLKAMSREELKALRANIDAQRKVKPKVERSSFKSGNPTRTIDGPKDRYAPLESGARYFSIKVKRK